MCCVPSFGTDAAHQCSKQTTGSCGSFGPAISVGQKTQWHLQGKGAEVVEQKSHAVGSAMGKITVSAAKVHGKMRQRVGYHWEQAEILLPGILYASGRNFGKLVLREMKIPGKDRGLF